MEACQYNSRLGAMLAVRSCQDVGARLLPVSMAGRGSATTANPSKINAMPASRPGPKLSP